jgi:hypothetical protein
MYSISKKIRFVFLLILIIQTNIIVGQETEFVYGTLINSDDQTPIPFAHITIKNKAKGTISNMDGGFRIPGKYYKSKDTLVISSIGYSSKVIPLISLNQHLRNVIILLRKEEVLDEITLGNSRRVGQTSDYSTSSKKKRLKAKDIVQLAIDQIPENYPYSPFSYVGYYRDYQMHKGNYINLNEGVMHVFDAGFGVSDSTETQTRIYNYQKNKTFPEDSIAAKPYNYDPTFKTKYISNTNFGTPKSERNEFTLLRIHDALRNYNINTYDFVNRLDWNFIFNHKFKFLPETSFDHIPLYAISIYKIIGPFSAIGKIFISKTDYKIYKMQYGVYDKSSPLTPHNSTPADWKQLEKNEKKLGKLLYEVIVEYQLDEGIMYPNYISFNNSFICYQLPKFYATNLEITDSNHIKLTFSRNPAKKYAMKKGNYKFYYNYKLLKIDRIEVDKNIVLLYLNKENLLNATQNETAAKLDPKNLTRQLKNIFDIYGYEINKSIFLSYNQYREFFVQELDRSTNKPIDSLYMRWDQPIKNQPIAPKENLQEFWMNTPLKN